MKKIKVASWNIAGGRKVKSADFFDYESENAGYFSGILKKLSPNLVCIQENHLKRNYSVAREIAKEIELPNIYDVTMSPSHIEKGFKLGMSILSDKQLNLKKLYEYPYPAFKLMFPDGRPVVRHNKGFLLAKYDNFYIADTQLQPLGFFGYSYKTGEGLHLASEIEGLMVENLKTPLIFCGDFSENFSDNGLYSGFGGIFTKLKLKNALPEKTTRPVKSKRKTIADFILYSEEFRLLRSEVITTKTDHYLCSAEFEYD